ncbi:hypothetical protein [Haloglycomyces albus]|uniref:hypothetical protein n=1 Tax=Haloglycomyces albus TaxID=526067 RepID=UPI00046CB751|nr:hypothetical protein [Haloglycomyces albus]
MVDNSVTDEYAMYDIEPRRVPRTDGTLVGPRNGYTLSVELLQRDPIAATIIDDVATSQSQVDTLFTQSGAWRHWDLDGYTQYRGSGGLDFDNDFESQSLYLQARVQFPVAGAVRLNICGITAELFSDGTLRLLRGSTVLDSTTVGAIEVGAPAGSGRAVVTLRVRDSTARVYYSDAESWVPLVLEATLDPVAGTGACGNDTDEEMWIDHLYLGDGWWYQSREAVDIDLDGQTQLLGRIARTGITWDTANRFQPDTDVDEEDTRTNDTVISLDWDFEHWRPAPLTDDTGVRLCVVPTNHDVWIGRITAVDMDAGEIVYWSVRKPSLIGRLALSMTGDHQRCAVDTWTGGRAHLGGTPGRRIATRNQTRPRMIELKTNATL